MKVFLIAICAAVMFTILLVSANTMAMSVRERVREVGVLKTLGFTDGNMLGHDSGRGDVRFRCWAERIGFLLSTVLMGGVAHSPAGGISAADRAIRARRWRWRASLTALAIGLVSSLVPALGASRTPIVEALRSTD